jgi:tryptophan synthase beta chain
MDTVKYFLPEDRMPTAWYNIQADLPEPLSPPVRIPAPGNPSAQTTWLLCFPWR